MEFILDLKALKSNLSSATSISNINFRKFSIDNIDEKLVQVKLDQSSCIDESSAIDEKSAIVKNSIQNYRRNFSLNKKLCLGAFHKLRLHFLAFFDHVRTLVCNS